MTMNSVRGLKKINSEYRNLLPSKCNWQGPRVELLFLHIQRSQFRWLKHLMRMPPGNLLDEVLMS